VLGNVQQRLTQEQLTQIVAEVEQLSVRQQNELDAAEVREILTELNLPPELLEDAIAQLQRREALAAQQRRNRWIIGGIAAAIATLATTIAVVSWQHQRALNRVTAQHDRITLTQDDGGNLSKIDRQANSEVFYRVMLKQAPVGEKLELACNWSDPNGQIVHQNRYQTKEINTPVWNTFCRHTIGAGASPGTWTVEMFLGDRQLSDITFDVK
jgi:hypothetical protein